MQFSILYLNTDISEKMQYLCKYNEKIYLFFFEEDYSDFVNKCKFISGEDRNCMKFHIIFSGVYFLHKEQEKGENKMKVEGIQEHYIFCKV